MLQVIDVQIYSGGKIQDRIKAICFILTSLVFLWIYLTTLWHVVTQSISSQARKTAQQEAKPQKVPKLYISHCQ